MSNMIRPPIILLREGVDQSQGLGQLISNINACHAIGEILASTLGPRGMDKLIHNGNNRRAIVTNDGATVMKELDIVHPAAQLLVDVAKSQDEEIGDGTTSVIVLATSMLDAAKDFLEDGVHPQFICRCYRTALNAALKKLEEVAVTIDGGQRKVLEQCAATTLRSKLVSDSRFFFAPMIVDAVLQLDEDMRLNDLGVKLVKGGSLQDSFFVPGVAFERTFSYAGFEQQPKHFKNPKILLLNVELELKAEGTGAEVRVEDAKEFQEVVDAEWAIIFRKLNDCLNSGANIVISKKPIGDVATQFFADHDIFSAGRVPDEDFNRLAKCTGASILSTTSNIEAKNLGTCADFEERQVGSKRFNIFTGGNGRAATIVLRGGAEQFLEEAGRSIHDAIMIVRRAKKAQRIVGGGGAIEMVISKHLHEIALKMDGKAQLIVEAFGDALEAIPRSLTNNAGFDSFETLNKLRSAHEKADGVWAGVDIETGGVLNAVENFIWEPLVVKKNALKAACEAACTILSVDETVQIPQHETTFDPGLPGQSAVRGRGGMPAPGAGMPAGGLPGMR
ncbi:chaperonin subunit eta CCTeta, putative [Trichomonas vaginalis G3]|uniref:T-complex protein 1 subunit eta n=1 Tax=Trichomonas vaginalis (strain ATCC PRA-98 / G3) TaxID=412133 RepID=A2D8X5_TRIV3|nr:chaperonin subunit eta CCTeta [Trichomonas vaginalis G3]EAY23001.1 chaperonin subunit eta CCTeta, putative [Trichomonas vaginalis G3]KAI5518963.1 chaperonin subunit eta CCTeta [Trichomonas vaginalis G3]|eukprot:XP_001583987.1 chaperonin subunit eta CCTeta [Trichomonas vaginalis G3]